MAEPGGRQHTVERDRPPVHVVRLLGVVGLKRDRERGRPILVVLQRVPRPTRPAAAAAGLEDQMRPDARVVELLLAEAESLTAPDDLASALELVERHVDAPVGEDLQRALDALTADQRAEIA